MKTHEPIDYIGRQYGYLVIVGVDREAKGYKSKKDRVWVQCTGGSPNCKGVYSREFSSIRNHNVVCCQNCARYPEIVRAAPKMKGFERTAEQVFESVLFTKWGWGEGRFSY